MRTRTGADADAAGAAGSAAPADGSEAKAGARRGTSLLTQRVRASGQAGASAAVSRSEAPPVLIRILNRPGASSGSSGRARLCGSALPSAAEAAAGSVPNSAGRGGARGDGGIRQSSGYIGCSSSSIDSESRDARPSPVARKRFLSTCSDSSRPSA
ncbi:hypothetical protein T492DRAFT_1017950 [Pavlovales sp. CCMP2436]|nr:hypothetical protein T492DRAFT_1017950 [Pavlovales sp. CCMP2436]